MASNTAYKDQPQSSSTHDLRSSLSGEIIQLYRNNPFRVLGLPIHATLREAEKRVQRLKVMAAMGERAPDEYAVREALQVLREPQRRLLAELFWFSPDPNPASPDAQAMQKLREGKWVEARAIWSKVLEGPASETTRRAIHNLAVLLHARVVTLETGKNGPLEKLRTDEAQQIRSVSPSEVLKDVRGDWHKALQLWSRYAADDEVWSQWRQRIESLRDKRLRPEYADELRTILPDALLQINRDLARRYADANFGLAAAVHCTLMQASGFPVEQALYHARAVIEPIKKRIVAACEELESKVEDPAGAGATFVPVLTQHVAQFQDRVRYDALTLAQIDREKKWGSSAAREAIAHALQTAANEFTNHNRREYGMSLKLLDDALRFADTIFLQDDIRDSREYAAYMNTIWSRATKTCLLCQRPPDDWELFGHQDSGRERIGYLCAEHSKEHNEAALLKAVSKQWNRLPLAPPRIEGVEYE